MKRNLILAALALTVFFVCLFLFWGIGESVLEGYPKLKGEAFDLGLAASVTFTLIVMMTVNRVLRRKR